MSKSPSKRSSTPSPDKTKQLKGKLINTLKLQNHVFTMLYYTIEKSKILMQIFLFFFVRSHNKSVPNWFRRFGVYRLKTNRQTSKAYLWMFTNILIFLWGSTINLGQTGLEVWRWLVENEQTDKQSIYMDVYKWN